MPSGGRGSNQYQSKGSSVQGQLDRSATADLAAAAVPDTDDDFDVELVAFAFHDQGRGWRDPEDVEEFSEILVSVNRPLTDDEISRLSGAMGYAVKVQMGENLVSDPDKMWDQCFRYDCESTWANRSTPITEVFDAVKETIREGSPIRKTDRKGPGTKGTRLVNGIGPDVKVSIRVR